MRRIKKIKEPKSLKRHRKMGFANYNNYADKNDVRTSLHKEQRGICCYCMGSISPDMEYMKIEHFKCQDNYPEDQLRYYNLLGACKGNEGQPENEQHCDTFKGSKELTYHPCSRFFEAMIKYDNDGSITSTNTVLNLELNSILNLNIKKLKAARKGVLDGFKDSLSRKKKGTLQKATLKKWLADWEGSSHQDNLRPYCMVVAFWLRKKLN